MGTWENNQNALREYANTLRGGIPSNYKNISNVALGSMINAAWARQAQEEAERKGTGEEHFPGKLRKQWNGFISKFRGSNGRTNESGLSRTSAQARRAAATMRRTSE